MKLNDKTYDVLKWIAIIGLPASATLLKALQVAWHWDIPTESIVQTIVAIQTFLGAVLAISNANYKASGE